MQEATHNETTADPEAPGGRVAEIDTPDGYRLKYRVWDPMVDDPRATLVLLNGVMSHSLWFAPLAPPLLRAGFKIVGADRRGTGANDVARGDAPSGKALLDDAIAIVDAERLAGKPTYLAGWCWGAVLGINLAAEWTRDAARRGPLAGIAFLAPGLFPTAELKRRMAAQEALARESPADRACLESPISEDMFTQGPALAGFISHDTGRLTHFTPRFHGIMAKLGMGARLKLPALDLPILLVLASRDLATDNAETERGLAQIRAGVGAVAVEHIDGAHGLQFDAPHELARAIVAWCERVGA